MQIRNLKTFKKQKKTFSAFGKQLQSHYKAKLCFSSIQERAALIPVCWRSLQTAGPLPSVPWSSNHQPASGNHQCKQRRSGGAQAPLCLPASPRTSLREQHENAKPALDQCVLHFHAPISVNECVCAQIWVCSCVLIPGSIFALAAVQKDTD